MKIQNYVAGIASALALGGCGPDVNNYYGAGGNGSSNLNQPDDDFCDALCSHVWLDCNGLPTANYNLGSSYANCISGCPAYLSAVRGSKYAEEMDKALRCVAYGFDGQQVEVPCSKLAKDACGMDEGDLFSKY